MNERLPASEAASVPVNVFPGVDLENPYAAQIALAKERSERSVPTRVKDALWNIVDRLTGGGY